jgi:hypothetical protein
MTTLTLPVRLPANPEALVIMNRTVVRKRFRALRIRGNGTLPSAFDFGTPRLRERIEVFDFARRTWLKPDREIARRLNRLAPEQVKALLRHSPYGYRLAPEFEDAPALEAVLDAALGRGWLDLGQRRYKLGMSRGGHISVTGSFGTVNYGREALLDALQRGHF